MIHQKNLSYKLIAVPGYYRPYKKLRDYLSTHPALKGKIQINGKEDPIRTGNFEVTIKETGYALHSKQYNKGQSMAKSQKERDAIVTQLIKLLEKKNKVDDESTSKESYL